MKRVKIMLAILLSSFFFLSIPALQVSLPNASFKEEQDKKNSEEGKENEHEKNKEEDGKKDREEKKE